MKIKTFLPALTLALSGMAAHADTTVFSEGFESFAALTTNGWVLTNSSAAPLGNNWFAGNGIFTAADGTSNSYAAANYLSTTALTGAVSNWLITPQISIANGYTLSFKVRADGDGFLDTLNVLMSPTGSSATADFTSVLGSYASSTDDGWVTTTYTISGLAAAASARIGFQYTVADVATAGNYLGLDTVAVMAPTVVPEPASALLFGLGIAGLAGFVGARRRS